MRKIYTSEGFNKKDLHQEWIAWIRNYHWDYSISANLLKTDDDFSARKKFKRFIQELNYKRYNVRNYKKFRHLGISSCSFLERGKCGSLHFHILLDDVLPVPQHEIYKTWIENGGRHEKLGKKKSGNFRNDYQKFQNEHTNRVATETKWIQAYNENINAWYNSKECLQGNGELWRIEQLAHGRTHKTIGVQ